MSKFIDITGKKFNKLTVVERLDNAAGGIAVWKCICDCGNITVVRGSNLKNGAVKSCGCLSKIATTTTHGMSKSRLYSVWNAMKSRCRNPNAVDYNRYGGRGISVCDDWYYSFLHFYQWAIENGYSDDMSIERIDNDGDYCPENCRWATRKEQCRNRSSNARFEYNGESRILTEWCEIFGIEYKLAHNRIYKLGWDFEKAVKTPKIYKRKNN